MICANCGVNFQSEIILTCAQCNCPTYCDTRCQATHSSAHVLYCSKRPAVEDNTNIHDNFQSDFLIFELVHEIVKYLDPLSLANFELTCTSFYGKFENLWEIHYMR